MNLVFILKNGIIVNKNIVKQPFSIYKSWQSCCVLLTVFLRPRRVEAAGASFHLHIPPILPANRIQRVRNLPERTAFHRFHQIVFKVSIKRFISVKRCCKSAILITRKNAEPSFTFDL